MERPLPRPGSRHRGSDPRPTRHHPLATLSLADVLYLNLRERSAEFVTPRTIGWSDRYLVQVVATEAAILGLLGTIPGSLIGLLIGVQLGVPVLQFLLASTISILGGLIVALLASVVPLAHLSTLIAPSVLAEE